MLDKLQDIVRCYTDDTKVILAGDMVLMTDLGLNSYELVQLVCEVEEMFNVEIPDRVIGSFKTVQNVLDYIAAHE